PLGQSDHARLRCAVFHEGRPHPAGSGRDVDDGSGPAVTKHGPYDMLAGEKHGLQVDVDRPVENLWRDVEKALPFENAGIVDQNIDRPVLLLYPFEDG